MRTNRLFRFNTLFLALGVALGTVPAVAVFHAQKYKDRHKLYKQYKAGLQQRQVNKQNTPQQQVQPDQANQSSKKSWQDQPIYRHVYKNIPGGSWVVSKLSGLTDVKSLDGFFDSASNTSLPGLGGFLYAPVSSLAKYARSRMRTKNVIRYLAMASIPLLLSTTPFGWVPSWAKYVPVLSSFISWPTIASSGLDMIFGGDIRLPTELWYKNASNELMPQPIKDIDPLRYIIDDNIKKAFGVGNYGIDHLVKGMMPQVHQ